ncbi:MAG: hypothetical protein QNL80_08090 [Akkermansiaceae bacterium]
MKASLVIESFEGDWKKEWLGYREATGDWSITTHELHDPQWKAPENVILSLEVRSAEANPLMPLPTNRTQTWWPFTKSLQISPVLHTLSSRLA